MLRPVGYSLDEFLRLRVGSQATEPATARRSFEQLRRERSWRGETELRREAGAIVAVEVQANHLDRLLGDLLDLTRLEACRLERQRRTVDPVELAAVGVGQTRALVEGPGGHRGAESEPGRGPTFWLTVPLGAGW